METVRLRPLCYELGFNATRPEQWISRGYFKPSEIGVPGRARQLTKRDAVMLLALVELVDAGFDASTIHREVQNLTLYKQKTYLVISRGRLGFIIPPSERGAPAPSEEDSTRVTLPLGMFRSAVVPEEKLLETITDDHKSVSVVISLDGLLDRVNTAWEKISESSDNEKA
ncbi:hypothetical protein ABE527_05725 [Brucella sp. TWI432]